MRDTDWNYKVIRRICKKAKPDRYSLAKDRGKLSHSSFRQKLPPNGKEGSMALDVEFLDRF
jgi:hypothetical protein